MKERCGKIKCVLIKAEKKGSLGCFLLWTWSRTLKKRDPWFSTPKKTSQKYTLHQLHPSMCFYSSACTEINLCQLWSRPRVNQPSCATVSGKYFLTGTHKYSWLAWEILMPAKWASADGTEPALVGNWAEGKRIEREKSENEETHKQCCVWRDAKSQLAWPWIVTKSLSQQHSVNKGQLFSQRAWKMQKQNRLYCTRYLTICVSYLMEIYSTWSHM